MASRDAFSSQSSAAVAAAASAVTFASDPIQSRSSAVAGSSAALDASLAVPAPPRPSTVPSPYLMMMEDPQRARLPEWAHHPGYAPQAGHYHAIPFSSSAPYPPPSPAEMAPTDPLTLMPAPGGSSNGSREALHELDPSNAMSHFTAWEAEPPPGPDERRGSVSSSFAESSGDLGMPVYFDPFTIKHRRRTTPEQLVVLEGEYRANPKPTPARRKELADQISMTAREVQVWYQNRRAKSKKLAKRAADRVGGEGRRGSESETSGVYPPSLPNEPSPTLPPLHPQANEFPFTGRQPYFAAASVVPPASYSPIERPYSAAYDHPTPRLGANALLPPAGTSGEASGTPTAVAPPGYLPYPHGAWEADGGASSPSLQMLDTRNLSQSQLIPDPDGPNSAGSSWSRRPSTVSLASDVTDLITPLTAQFSFGDSSGPPSSATSHDSFHQSDMDLKRRSSCPAEFVNSMGAFALSSMPAASNPAVAVQAVPSFDVDGRPQHPIAQWSYAVPPSAAPDDPSRSRWGEHLMIQRRHSVSTVPWPQQRTEQLSVADSPSPEIGRSPLPAHLYPAYGRRPSSGASSLLTIEEGSAAELEPQRSAQKFAAPPGTVFDPASSSASGGLRRPPIERKARSHSSLRTMQSHFGLEMTRTASDISTDRLVAGSKAGVVGAPAWSGAPWQEGTLPMGMVSAPAPAPLTRWSS